MRDEQLTVVIERFGHRAWVSIEGDHEPLHLQFRASQSAARWDRPVTPTQGAPFAQSPATHPAPESPSHQLYLHTSSTHTQQAGKDNKATKSCKRAERLKPKTEANRHFVKGFKQESAMQGRSFSNGRCRKAGIATGWKYNRHSCHDAYPHERAGFLPYWLSNSGILS
jgi:hypothetical protein